MCLKSNYLERRIQGIKELGMIIKNFRIFSTKNFTGAFLVEWLAKNEVFSIIFTPKTTHLQLVQRSSDILKLFLSEDMFTQDQMAQFWALTKSDYKFEVYKIISDISYNLK